MCPAFFFTALEWLHNQFYRITMFFFTMGEMPMDIKRVLFCNARKCRKMKDMGCFSPEEMPMYIGCALFSNARKSCKMIDMGCFSPKEMP
jgi:hypothetical protein